MRITNLFWTVVLLAPLSVFAQQHKENLFTIDAQIRTRGEYRNGVLNPRPEGEEPTYHHYIIFCNSTFHQRACPAFFGVSA